MKIGKLSPKRCNFGGTYIGEHCFQTEKNSSVKVPLFYVETVHSLNQILGYAKFKNSAFGSVYFRGENQIHQTLNASIYRPIPEKTRLPILEQNLNRVINSLINNKNFSNFIKTPNDSEQTQKYIMEAMLQHYGFHTHFLDVVDNPWVALWFGLYKFQYFSKDYYSYQNRTMIFEHQVSIKKQKEDQFQYLILIAADHPIQKEEKGISFGNEIITLDLRKALPSLFLRPHAQNSLALRTVSNSGDFAKNVVGILKFNIKTVNEWLGRGGLLSYRTFFPAPAFDQGYDILIQINPSCHVNKILKYI